MRGQMLQQRYMGKQARRCLLAGLLAASGQSVWADQPTGLLPPLPLVAPGVADPFLQSPVSVPVVVLPPSLSPATAAMQPTTGTAVRPMTAVASRHLTIVPGSANLPTPLAPAAVSDPVAGSGQAGTAPLMWQAAAVPSPMIAVSAPLAAVPVQSEGTEPLVVADSMVIEAVPELVKLQPLTLPQAEIAAISLPAPVTIARPVGYSVSFSDNSHIEMDQTDRSTLIRPAAPMLSVADAPAVEFSFSDSASALRDEQDLVPARSMKPVQSWKGSELPVAAPDPSRLVNGGRPRVEVERSTVAVDRMATAGIVSSHPRVLTVDGLPAPLPEGDLGHGASVEFVDVRQTAPTSQRMLQSVLTPPSSLSERSPAESARGGWQPPLIAPPTGDAIEMTLAADEKDNDIQRPLMAMPTNLQLKPTEVRSLKLDATIVDIQCDNLDVCTLIRSTPSSLQVIATGQGRAHLVVHAMNKEGREQVEQYVITVGHSRHTNDSLDNVAMALTQTVQNSFPGANVLVSATDGRLTVTGSSPDEATARRILRMIRSACVVPVVDKVLVR